MPKLNPDQVRRTKSEQQAETEALFNSIGDGAITTDEFGRITRVNPAAQELLGYKEGELLGHWFPNKIIAVTPKDEPINLIDRSITKAFLTGKPISAKMYYRRKDGFIFPVAVNVSPIILDDKPLGAIEVFRDITIEEQIDRMKSEFISLASHLLRTPLSAIKTYSHMLADGLMGEINPEQRKFLDTIVNASNRMNELISTLLNITRMESGSIALTNKQFNMMSVINELLPELIVMAGHKQVSLSLASRGKASLNITSDPLIVKEIITNLASNAIKYTPESGSVKINVRPRRSDILIHISDSGWGIPLQAQEQVFSKFFRAHNILQRETTGTGLGLYLVKGLVDVLGGKIWFKSEEGKGTDFYFALPRTKAVPKARQKTA